VDPATVVRIEPAEMINPDSSERASPVVIRIYELSSSGAFKDADFFKLYDDADDVLGNDLISVEDMVVRPGQVHHHMMRLSSDTRYIGVMAAFRDIQSAQWRVVSEADPSTYRKLHLEIDELTLKRSWKE